MGMSRGGLKKKKALGRNDPGGMDRDILKNLDLL